MAILASGCIAPAAGECATLAPASAALIGPSLGLDGIIRARPGGEQATESPGDPPIQVTVERFVPGAIGEESHFQVLLIAKWRDFDNVTLTTQVRGDATACLHSAPPPTLAKDVTEEIAAGVVLHSPGMALIEVRARAYDLDGGGMVAFHIYAEEGGPVRFSAGVPPPGPWSS